MKKVIFALSALTMAASVLAAPAAPVAIDPPLALDAVSVSIPGDIDPPFAPDFMDAFAGDIDPPV